jgi:hypothetical protein
MFRIQNAEEKEKTSIFYWKNLSKDFEEKGIM